MAKSVDTAKSGSNQLSGEAFRSFINLFAEIEKDGDAYRARKKKARKEARAAGMVLGEADAIMRMTDWTPEEIKESFDVRIQYAKFMKMPVGSQGSLLSDESDVPKESQGEIVFSKAYQAGVLGKSPECPEQYLDHNQEWGKGWKAGQDSLAMDMLNKNKKS